MKKLIKILVLLLIGLIIALMLVPYLFKGELLEFLKKEINEQVEAKVDFEDLDISLFSDFPSISLSLVKLSVVGIDSFEGQQLLSTEELVIGTDISSVIKPKEGINIRSILINEPQINLIVDQSGNSNYDIAPESKESSSDHSFFGQIEKYEIRNGNIRYKDKLNNTSLSIKNLDHTGSGHFENIVFDLSTDTSIEEISMSSGGVRYLNQAQVKAEVDLGIDMDKSSYEFKKNLIQLNDLDLSLEGTVTQRNEALDLDLNIAAPNNSVSSILSMIPLEYAGGHGQIKSEGNSFLKGTIKGTYAGDQKIYPHIDMDVKIDKGRIQYPDLKWPIEDITLDLKAVSNSNDWSDLKLDLSALSFLIDQDRMAGKLLISQALDNPHVKGFMNGTLDFAKLAKAYPLNGIKMESGLIKIDLTVDAKAADISAQAYEKTNLQGQFVGTNVNFLYDQWPISMEQVKMNLDPKSIETTVVNSKIGKSDFSGNIMIDDPLALMSDSMDSSFDIDMKSELLDLDEISTLSEQSKTTDIDTTSVTDNIIETLSLKGSYKADKINYEEYELEKLAINMSLDDDRMQISSATITSYKEPLTLRGEVSDIGTYLYDDGTLNGKMYLNAKNLNLDAYTKESADDESISEPVLIPQKVKIDVYPEIGTVTYDKYVLTDVEGKIAIADAQANLTEGQANTMDGRIDLDGRYDSSDPNNLLFDMKYKMSDIKFRKMFENSKSFRALAPIAQRLEGIFNSTLVMAGPIKKDMTPDLYKVTASGFLETIKGELQSFEPIEKIANALGIDQLKKWNIKDSKNWFDIKDGKVLLKAHDHQVDDMIFTVAGNHSIDQVIDYKIKAQIPREKLSKDKLGKNLEFGMDFIEKEAQSRGVNIDLGEMIYLDIFLTGNIKNPKIKVLPVGSGGKTLNQVVKDEVIKQVDILKDTLTQELEKRTEKAKDSITKVIRQKTDTITQQVKDKAKTEVNKQKDILKDKLRSKLDTTVTQVLTDTIQTRLEETAREVLGNQSNAEIDSLKSKIKDWNPFKKKGN